MKLELDHGDARYVITSHEPGAVYVNEQPYHRSLLLTAERLLEDWGPRALADLQTVHLEQILELEPEIVLLGTGQALGFPPAEISRVLLERGIGLECMDTAAACRSFVVLQSEGRRVVAALIIG